MFALRSSQLWLASHSIVQQRAGRRQLSELRRTTPRSENILACLLPSPSNGVLTSWASKSSTKPQSSTPPLGAGIPAKERLHRRRGTVSTKWCLLHNPTSLRSRYPFLCFRRDSPTTQTRTEVNPERADDDYSWISRGRNGTASSKRWKLYRPLLVCILEQDLATTWVTIETVAKEMEYRSMTLQIEFRKRLHVVSHHPPVRQSGSDCISTGSRSVEQCQSPEKYDINMDNVPLAIPTQSKCRVQCCRGSNLPMA